MKLYGITALELIGTLLNFKGKNGSEKLGLNHQMNDMSTGC